MPSLRQLLGLAGDRQVEKLHAVVKQGRRELAADVAQLQQEVKALRRQLHRGDDAAGSSGQVSMEKLLQCLSQTGMEVATVIDIGASDGQWTRMALPHFPHAHYLLVEAQACHEPALRAFTADKEKVSFVMAAAGKQVGEVHFDATDPFGGVASEHATSRSDIVVPVTTVDTEMLAKQLQGPVLIKFDTHGYEVPILARAERTLEHTAAIIMECYNFKISPDCLLFHEMCGHLEGFGFRPFIMADVVHRPQDGALWQMDIAFVKAERPEFKRRGYR
jgi:FkbM family methyltransferase